MTLNLVRSQTSPLGGATIHSKTNLEFHKALEPEGGGNREAMKQVLSGLPWEGSVVITLESL